MSLVSSRVSLTHRCTVRRNENATIDPWGSPDLPGWVDIHVDQVCRGWTTAGREAIHDTTTVVVEDRRLTMLLDADVTQLDQIGDVTYRGALVLDGPMRIDAIVRYADRLELILTRVT